VAQLAAPPLVLSVPLDFIISLRAPPLTLCSQSTPHAFTWALTILSSSDNPTTSCFCQENRKYPEPRPIGSILPNGCGTSLDTPAAEQVSLNPRWRHREVAYNPTVLTEPSYQLLQNTLVLHSSIPWTLLTSSRDTGICPREILGPLRCIP